jgi:hypothetical protein
MNIVKFTFNDKGAGERKHISVHTSKANAISTRAALCTAGRCSRGSGTIETIDVPSGKPALLEFINGLLDETRDGYSD